MWLERLVFHAENLPVRLRHQLGSKLTFEKNEVHERLKKVEKSIISTAALDAPIMAAILLGVFAKFTPDAESLHPLLGNPVFVNGLLIIAVPLTIFCGIRIVKLTIEKGRLLSKIKEAKEN